MVFIPNCDKIVPGMLMAAARINVPAIVVSGGPMLSLRHNDKNLDLNSVFEAVGAYKAGKMTEKEVGSMRKKLVPAAVPVPVCLPPTP